MKKYVLLSAILFLWALSAGASELPPYSEYSFSPFYLQQTQQLADTGVEMFPNPVTEGSLTIKSEESFHHIQILNITGELVFNREYPSGTNTEVIELTHLKKGMYLVRVSFSGKPNHTAKIIIK